MDVACHYLQLVIVKLKQCINMKILSYNISTCKQWKVDRLLEMDADVFIVPEIACIEQVAIPEGYEIAWNGIKWEYGEGMRSKGLGIIWKKGCGVIPEWYNPELTFAIPLICNGTLVLAFWPTKRKGVSDQMKYPQIAQILIEEYKPHFAENPTVIIGDFNCYVNQSDYTKKYGDILRVNEILEYAGLHSVYHKQTGEKFGEETHPTYFHLFKPELPFMLDYAYTNIKVKSFSLLQPDLKMSDHVGLCLEI